MHAHPLTDRCRTNHETRAHVCFGISPFNSYFTAERIGALARWGKLEFAAVHFFVPDVPSAYTLEAMGHPPDKAAWKARRQGQYLCNKIERALVNSGLSLIAAREAILNWEVLSANTRYLELHQETLHRFEIDNAFQRACIEASRWVLEKRVPDPDALSMEVLKSAVRYLLAEIPLFCDTAGIVGKPASVFAYHQCPRFIEALLRGQHPIQPAQGQGFLVLEAGEA